jgi:hypothetical protein
VRCRSISVATSALHSFLSLPHTPQRACPRSFTLAPRCPSYTRSLTCNNLLFIHFPFSRQPSHPSSSLKNSPPSRRDPVASPSGRPALCSKRIPPLWELNLVACIAITLHGDCACLLRPDCPPTRPIRLRTAADRELQNDVRRRWVRCLPLSCCSRSSELHTRDATCRTLR